MTLLFTSERLPVPYTSPCVMSCRGERLTRFFAAHGDGLFPVALRLGALRKSDAQHFRLFSRGGSVKSGTSAHVLGRPVPSELLCFFSAFSRNKSCALFFVFD